MKASMVGTARHLVIAKLFNLVIEQTAYRTKKEADKAAEELRGDQRVVSVEVSYVANYRGRRFTRVLL